MKLEPWDVHDFVVEDLDEVFHDTNDVEIERMAGDIVAHAKALGLVLGGGPSVKELLLERRADERRDVEEAFFAT